MNWCCFPAAMPGCSRWRPGRRAVLGVAGGGAAAARGVAGGHWRWLMGTCPHLARRLAGARLLLDRPVAVAGIPYGYLHRPGGGWRVPAGGPGGGDSVIVRGRVWRSRCTAGGGGRGVASGDAARRRCIVGAFGGIRVRPMRVAGLAIVCAGSSGDAVLDGAACRHWPGLLRQVAAATRVVRTVSGGSGTASDDGGKQRRII